ATAPAAPIGKLPGHAAGDLALQCALRPIADGLEITYTAKNAGSDDAYLLDLSSTPRADRSDVDVEVRPIYLTWLGGTAAHLGQGVAPLPADRQVAVRVIPLANRLARGASITRTVRLLSPLAELGPYDPAAATPGGPTIDRLVITLSAMRASAPGFNAEEMRGHAGVFRVSSKYTVGDLERARCEVALPATVLRIFRWEDGHVPTFVRAE
ncbi:MAG: hypothetical protein JWP87_1013, partial [Labilithrix sp.]|nr:hypothetical protein [Labilithrix sp.]